MSKGLAVLRWTPRILCILSILFISMFALDSFDGGKPVQDQIIEFLIHLIPSFVLIVILLIAWFREFTGGLILMVIGLGLSPLIFIGNYNRNESVAMSLLIIATITFPLILTGFLFIISFFVRRKNRLKTESKDHQPL